MKKGFHKFENNDGDCSASEEEVLPARITYLTPALIELARTQLNETEESREKCLSELRKRIEAEPKFVSPTDDKFLLAFLRARKFNVKKAFKLLQNFWTFRKDYDYIYDFSDFGSVIETLLHSFVGILPYRDRNGCLVFVAKFGLWDPEIDTYENLFRAITGTLIYTMEHEATQIAGFRAILDMRGVGWKQMKYVTPANVILLIRSTQFCFPGRYKGIHILSENRMLNFLWMLISPFLTSKLRKRITFHGDDMSPLLQYIHPSVLPEEFGGRAPFFENSEWKEEMENHLEGVTKMLEYGYKD